MEKKVSNQLILGLFLILLGCFLFIFQGKVSCDGILEMTDNNLMETATAADWEMVKENKMVTGKMRYISYGKGMDQAAAVFGETGSKEEAASCLTGTVEAQDYPISDLLALRSDGEIFSNLGKEYIYLGNVSSDAGLYRYDGKYYLGFSYARRSGFSCIGLIEAEDYYNEILPISGGGSGNLVMAGKDNNIVIYTNEDKIVVCVPEYDNENEHYGEKYLALINDEKAGIVTYADHGDEGVYNARIGYIPANLCANGVFGVGMLLDYDATLDMKKATMLFALYAAIIIIGVLLLLHMSYKAVKRNARSIRAMHILREKNKAAENLNKNIENLMHHQRLETIGTMTSSIAHEINNMLTPVMGYSIMALEMLGPDQEELSENITEIYNASNRARKLVRQLTDLSRKNVQDTYEVLSPDVLVKEAKEVFITAKTANIELLEDLNCPSKCISCNRTQMIQVLLNLSLNAFQAMEKDGGELKISTRIAGDMVFITISDTGPGISEENIRRVFEPFFTTKQSGKGTGLGLAIVSQIIDEHRGNIRVESEPGEGCTFIINLPLCESPDEDDDDLILMDE